MMIGACVSPCATARQYNNAGSRLHAESVFEIDFADGHYFFNGAFRPFADFIVSDFTPDIDADGILRSGGAMFLAAGLSGLSPSEGTVLCLAAVDVTAQTFATIWALTSADGSDFVGERRVSTNANFQTTLLNTGSTSVNNGSGGVAYNVQSAAAVTWNASATRIAISVDGQTAWENNAVSAATFPTVADYLGIGNRHNADLWPKERIKRMVGFAAGFDNTDLVALSGGTY